MGKFDKYSWGTPPKPIPEEEITKTVTCDVVIVGAGLSGVSAALRCTENGLDTVLIEKGRRNSARGLHVGVANSRLLRKYGIVNDIDEIADEWISVTSHRANIDLIRLFLNKSEPAMDWVLDKAEAHGMGVYIFGGGYHGKSYKEFVCTHIFDGGVEGLASMLLGQAMENGLRAHYFTSGRQLVKENGRITGVIASTPDCYVKYTARMGVILSTGDISGSREMCEDLSPFALKGMKNINHHAPQLTGDGHKMGIWAGADMQEAPFPFAIHTMAYSINSFFFLLVNQSGRRYMNEDCWGQGKSTYTIRQNPEHPWGYVIFDDNYLNDLCSTIQYGGGLFWDSTVRALGAPFDPAPIEYAVDTCVSEGQVGWKADTITELAGQLGIPGKALEETVARYNSLCTKGHDDDYGKRPELMTPVLKPPFYALKISGALLHIPGGLSVDCNMQVLDTHRRPMPGLYAIGNCAGELYAVDYPLIINGSNHGRCITFGKLAADVIAGKGQL